MTVIINGSNTPTAGGVTYGDGTQYATTSAGTSGQALISAGSSAPAFGNLGVSAISATGTPSSSTFLRGDGSWTAVSTPTAATQTDQETATSTSVFVSPGTQQYHPSAAKCWIKANFAQTIYGSYNVASITDAGTGLVTVTMTTAFSSTNYAIVATTMYVDPIYTGVLTSSVSTSSFRTTSYNYAGSLADGAYVMAVAFGDQ